MNDLSVKPGVAYADIEAAAARLEGVAHRTPVATSTQFDTRMGCEAYFKCENFQRMGAFKFRGAYNTLSKLNPEQRKRGVVAFSSGNHAQAVALAGKLLGVPATIVMPKDAPAVKVAATRGYGAEVVLFDRVKEDREEIAARLSAERGCTLVPPFDHPDVIAGQGTCTKELIEEVGPLDYLFVCCGGAGLLSGCAIAANHLSPGTKVVGVEPAAGNDVQQSFRAREIRSIPVPDTIADGARTQAPSALTLGLVLQNVHDMITVSDAQLVEAPPPLLLRVPIKGVMAGVVDFSAHGVFTTAISEMPLTEGDWLAAGLASINLIGSATLITLPGTGPHDAEWVSDPDYRHWAEAMQSASISAGAATLRKDRAGFLAAANRIALTRPVLPMSNTRDWFTLLSAHRMKYPVPFAVPSPKNEAELAKAELGKLPPSPFPRKVKLALSASWVRSNSSVFSRDPFGGRGTVFKLSTKMIHPCSHPPLVVQVELLLLLQRLTGALRFTASLRARFSAAINSLACVAS